MNRARTLFTRRYATESFVSTFRGQCPRLNSSDRYAIQECHERTRTDQRVYCESTGTKTQRDAGAARPAFCELCRDAKLWFLDGKNSEGKVVSNPDIGYGSRDHKYADGTISEFYQIGLSANKTGISVYILGIEDKKYLAETYASNLGKATVTGYCIRFKTLKDINIDVLEAAIRFGFENTNEKVS